MIRLGRKIELNLSAILIAGSMTANLFAAEPNPSLLSVCDDISEYPPYTYFDRVNGKPTEKVVGFTVDLLKTIFKNDTLVFELVPWNRCMQLAKSGDHYQIVLGAEKTPEREIDFYFTEPFLFLQSDYYYSRNKFPNGMNIKTLADLQRYQVCGLFGYNYQRYGLSGSKILTTYKFQQLIPLIMHDNCDLFIEQRQVVEGHRKIDEQLRKLIDDPNLTHQRIPGIADIPYYLIVPRLAPNAQEIIDRLNSGLHEATKNGAKSDLMKKYNIAN